MNKLWSSFLLSAIVPCALAAGAAAEGPWLTDWGFARQAAETGGKPVLIEFHAVWCYSCYYMENNVLSKPAFLAEGPKSAVLLRLDVDTPEGREWKEKLAARVLPSFVVVDAAGKELGRIIGEQTEKEFLEQLRAITGAAKPDPLRALRGLIDRKELAAAAAERERLRAEKGKLPQDAEFRRLSLRLDLAEALEKKDAGRAGTALKALLPIEEDCALVPQAMDALELVPALKSAVAVRFQSLAEKRVFGKANQRCADLRSTVLVLADASSDAKKAALLRRTVSLLQKMAAKKGVGDDRNLDDNLRFFLETAGGKDAELGELYPKLAAAYPADYVYSYRWAKWLYGRKEHARALELAQKAWELSYGANRLTVTGLKARILTAMGQRDEAEQAVRAELKASRGRFPKDAVGLEKVLAELR
ncbi:MAG: hypothetical protein A2X36_03055 [Elusimicrobia bacterium GWA2_69_24]|nr:MAG: hypothetical protein A2X36_03055 [Elusimicrobia bacterium GWA2_69_24]HBL19233.1 hypothetical protein [Elusimicrobiota bacterium]